MSDIALPARPLPLPRTLPRKALAAAAKFWFVLAASGHLIFLAYILSVFFPPIAAQGLQGLQGMHLPSGFRQGDTLGNLAAVAHVLLAAIIIGGGPLQLIPALRARFPSFHRWLGRSYLLAAVTSSIGGLYMLMTRGSVGGPLNHLSLALDAILIIIFAAMAVRHAVARRLREHRRWAMRLFMAASAVWFYRIGLMAWVMLTGGIGVDFKSFTGPFLDVLGFAQYLLPLAMLEWYFRCTDRAGPGEQFCLAASLAGLTVIMGIGIFAATLGLWWPRM